MESGFLRADTGLLERVSWPIAPDTMETQTVKELEKSSFTAKDSCTHTQARALARIHSNDNHYSLWLKGAGQPDSVTPFTKLPPTNILN